jgi:hypothetical protein
MKKTLFTLLFFSVFLASCDKNNNEKKLDFNALFPDTAVNLADLNSPYDDYNSILPETHFGKAFIFSSNRNSAGSDFDLIGDKVHATWYMETSELVVDNSYYWQTTNWVTKLLHNAAITGNQFGPYSIGFDTVIDHVEKRINILVYSTNSESTNYHEELIYHESEDGGETGLIKGPFHISGISDDEKQYISFYGPKVQSIDNFSLNPNQFTQMYFNKTLDGKSDIFKVGIPDSLNFLQFLGGSAFDDHEAVAELNSTSNDFCPFINGNLLVFASDRPGGFGGYDLYYSYFDGSKWSDPVNFGEKINTSSDEFRPIAVNVEEFRNDLLIFSSNRQGGKGGFDLYYVGINKFSPQTIVN